MEPTRVLIADDHARFREGLSALLLSAPELEVVGEAEDGYEAASLAAELQPDVILMDLNMPGMDGVEATRRILHTSPHIRVLVISMFEDEDSVFAALQAGACGYLLKGALKAEILGTIRAVTNGEAIFAPTIANSAASRQKITPSEAFPELTEREREILSLLAQHQTNPEIARRLHLSQKSVRNHVSDIFAKLQVADRAQAIIRAREAGLGPDKL